MQSLTKAKGKAKLPPQLPRLLARVILQLMGPLAWSLFLQSPPLSQVSLLLAALPEPCQGQRPAAHLSIADMCQPSAAVSASSKLIQEGLLGSHTEIG